MAWYFTALIITLAVVLVLFILTFILYITNGDMKLVQVLYDKVIAYHDNKHVEEKIYKINSKRR